MTTNHFTRTGMTENPYVTVGIILLSCTVAEIMLLPVCCRHVRFSRPIVDIGHHRKPFHLNGHGQEPIFSRWNYSAFFCGCQYISTSGLLPPYWIFMAWLMSAMTGKKFSWTGMAENPYVTVGFILISCMVAELVLLPVSGRHIGKMVEDIRQISFALCSPRIFRKSRQSA